MASLTIRKLDDAIRDELRLRAARNGRSVEDEVRVILREASLGRTAHRPACGFALPGRACPATTAQPRVTLIIGGGIAAYKSLDLIRRLEGAAHPCPLRADKGRAAIRHGARRQRAVA